MGIKSGCSPEPCFNFSLALRYFICWILRWMLSLSTVMPSMSGACYFGGLSPAKFRLNCDGCTSSLLSHFPSINYKCGAYTSPVDGPSITIRQVTNASTVSLVVCSTSRTRCLWCVPKSKTSKTLKTSDSTLCRLWSVPPKSCQNCLRIRWLYSTHTSLPTCMQTSCTTEATRRFKYLTFRIGTH